MNQIKYEEYKIPINEQYNISRGYWSGRCCPIEIWIYDRYILPPTGCIDQYAIALSFMTKN